MHLVSVPTTCGCATLCVPTMWWLSLQGSAPHTRETLALCSPACVCWLSCGSACTRAHRDLGARARDSRMLAGLHRSTGFPQRGASHVDIAQAAPEGLPCRCDVKRVLPRAEQARPFARGEIAAPMAQLGPPPLRSAFAARGCVSDTCLEAHSLSSLLLHQDASSG